MLPIGGRGAPRFSAVQEETYESIRESDRDRPGDIIFENENFLELENMKPIMTYESHHKHGGGGINRLGKVDDAM